jgi:flagellar protein FlgJ
MDGGMAEDIFSDMLYDEYAKSMTKNAGFGLADQVYLQLTDYGRAKPE